MNVVLLNPPGRRRYVRSYYCGSTAKAGYLFQPVDLLILSGILQEEHNVFLVDCIADRLAPDAAIERIATHNPRAVICLVSIVSWGEDLEFLYRLKKEFPSLKIIANGDVFFEEADKKLRGISCIDAIIFDFICRDVINYLKGKEQNICNMIYRKGDDIIFKKMDVTNAGEVFSIPIPSHELFLNKNYRFPFAKRLPFTTVLTNFGCPFKCSFCIASGLGFKYRKSEEVIEELRYIWGLGLKEIFFEDMSFGLPKDNTIKLCRLMIENGFEFGWSCFSRVDLLDKQLLSLMKEAGCHTIIFGAESANEGILRIYNKGYTRAQIIEMFKLCGRLKIKTVATFILGLPEETRQTCLDTIKFAREIGCDYASFNVAVPRPGTELRRIAIKENLIQKEQLVFDHSASKASMASKYLSQKELSKLQRRAVREFYFRPSYIFKKIARVRSLTELKEHISGCLWLLANNIVKLGRSGSSRA